MVQHMLARGPFTSAFRNAFQNAAPSGMWVGLGSIPTSDGALVEAPYFIITPLWATYSGPPLGADRHADAEWTYQIECVGLRGDQLEGMRDFALAFVFGKTDEGAYVHNLNTDAVHVMERTPKDDEGFTEPVASVMPSMFRVGLQVTPADTAP